MAAKRAKFELTGILIMLAGIVIGSFVAELAKDVAGLSWLAYGQTFGLGGGAPVVLDLAALRIQFGISFTLNIAMILGMAASFFAWRKWF